VPVSNGWVADRKDDVGLVGLVDQLREPSDRPGESVDAIDEDQVEAAELCVAE
jgi:hypothetical protein